MHLCKNNIQMYLGKSCQYLSFTERHYIEISRKKEVSHNESVRYLGCSQVTISRVLLRNTGLSMIGINKLIA